MNFVCCLFSNCVAYALLNICCNACFNDRNIDNEIDKRLLENKLNNAIETYEKSDDIEETVFCPITQEEILNGEIIKKLPCGHKFSIGIKKWITQSNNCPICKANILNKP